MTTEYIALEEHLTAGGGDRPPARARAGRRDDLLRLRDRRRTTASSGVLSLRDLIVAQPDTRIRDVMIHEPVAVGVLADQDEVAEVVAHYNLLAVPGRRRRGAPRRHRHRRRRDRHRHPDGLEEAPPARVQPVGPDDAAAAPASPGRARDAPTRVAHPSRAGGRRRRARSGPRVAGGRARACSRRCLGSRSGASGCSRRSRSSGRASSAASPTTTPAASRPTRSPARKFGYELLWVILASQIVLFFTQEVGARLGLATGKGLMGLIRERWGVRWGAFAAILMLVANLGSTVAEFAGIGAALGCSGSRPRSARPSPRSIVVALHRPGQLQPRPVPVRRRRRSSCRSPTSSRRSSPDPDWSQAFQSLVRPAAVVVAGLLAGRRGHRRHDDHAVGPGVHPVVRRRQAPPPRRPAGEPRRRVRRARCSPTSSPRSSSSPAPRRSTRPGRRRSRRAAEAAQALGPLAGAGGQRPLRRSACSAPRSSASASCR